MTDKDEDPPDGGEIEIDEAELAERAAPEPAAKRPRDELPAGVPPRSGLSTRQIVWGAVPLCILLICGATSLVVRRIDRAAAEGQCTDRVGSVAAHLERGDLDLAGEAVGAISGDCADMHTAELQGLRQRIAAARAAASAAVRERSPEEEQDRRDGVKYTRAGHVAALTLEKLQLAVRYASAKDKQGFDILIRNDEEFIILKPQLKVNVLQRSGLKPPLVQIHVRGTPVDMWTTADALQDP